MQSVARLTGAEEAARAVSSDRSVTTFEEIYAEHFDYVWRTARRLGVPAADVADVVQEIFITVHRLLPRYEDKNFRGWLYSVAANVVLHHHRAARRLATERAEGDDLDGLPDARARGPE